MRSNSASEVPNRRACSSTHARPTLEEVSRDDPIQLHLLCASAPPCLCVKPVLIDCALRPRVRCPGPGHGMRAESDRQPRGPTAEIGRKERKTPTILRTTIEDPSNNHRSSIVTSRLPHASSTPPTHPPRAGIVGMVGVLLALAALPRISDFPCGGVCG